MNRNNDKQVYGNQPCSNIINLAPDCHQTSDDDNYRLKLQKFTKLRGVGLLQYAHVHCFFVP